MTFRLSAALRRGASLSLAAGSLTLIGAPALGQTNTVEGVIVTAPYEVGNTEEVRVSRTVSYADLDLKSYAGSVELDRRVAEAARVACLDLDKHYPEATPGNLSCQQNAVKAAQAQEASIRAIAQGRMPPTAAAAPAYAPQASTVEPRPATGGPN